MTSRLPSTVRAVALLVLCTADAQEPLRVGGDIRPPTKVVDVPPIFPAEAKLFGLEGVVIMETMILEDGSVGDVKVLRSIPLLEWGAITTVRKWRYEPTTLNGVPVPIVFTVTVNYSLGGSRSVARELGQALFATLDGHNADEPITWPGTISQAELSNYSVATDASGGHTYRGTLTNVSKQRIPNIRAVLVQRETAVVEGEQRETLRPVISELGSLEARASIDVEIHAENDGTPRDKVALLFATHGDDPIDTLVSVSATAGALGSR